MNDYNRVYNKVIVGPHFKLMRLIQIKTNDFEYYMMFQKLCFWPVEHVIYYELTDKLKRQSVYYLMR